MPLPEVLKSPTDTLEYQLVELSNGLLVVCVHEAEADQAAAAMSINAGHFDDPQSSQGLAHFLEHMLFLGTEGFPEADDYQNFISTHGGHHNAWTGTEHTNFFFSIQHDQLEPALDRFSRFFYQPLFDERWVEKERQAVESEFRMKLKDELRRLYEVHKRTSNPDHPFHKFSVGNLTTLKNQPDQSLVEQLQTFFAAHYHSKRMRLVLAGPQSLTELASLAETYFCDIKPSTKAKAKVTAPLYRPEQLGVCINVQPLKQARRMIMSFPLPPIDADYAHKTASFIAHIIGYEGPDSLFAALRQRDWINSLSAGGGMSGSNFKDFNINIQLTDEGLQHIETIAAWVFAYIRLIASHGLDEWRYQERKQLVELSFRYHEPVRTVELASQLSINAQHYSPADILYGDYRMDDLNKVRAEEFLSLMTPANLRLTVIHRHVDTDQVTPLYETPYKIERFSRHQLHQLAQTPDDFYARLPQPNEFICGQLTPAALTDPEASATAIPTKYDSLPALRIWHLQDADFRQPKGHIYTGFHLPAVAASAQSFANARLWCELVLDDLNERCYDAEIAGLHFNLYPQQRGVTLHIAGFSPTQAKLLQQVTKSMRTLLPNPKRWRSLRNKLISNWQSAHTHKPMNKLFAELNYTLLPGSYQMDELAVALSETDFNTFEDIIGGFFKEINIDVLCHGDLPATVISELEQVLIPGFQLQDQPQLDCSLQPRQLVPGKPQKIVASSSHSDSAMLRFVQGASTSLHDQAGFMLLNQFISPEIFNQLRTEQQLGYLVGSNYLPMQQVPGILMYVQSPSAKVDKLKSCLQRFSDEFLHELPELIAEDWRAVQQSLIRQLRDQDPNLRIRSQRLWSSITQSDTDFKRLGRLAEAVEAWQASAMPAFAEQHLGKQSAALWLHTQAD